MKQKFIDFWCNNFYPFCNLNKVKTDFTIIEDKNELFGDRLEKINLTKNEEIVNNLRRKQNLKELKNKGGVKKYLINWIAMTILYSIVVFGVIKPESFFEKLPFIVTHFLFFGGTLIMFLFYVTIDRKNMQ